MNTTATQEAPDPALVNATTGQPCRGKLAAQALARILNRQDVRDLLADEAPGLLDAADAALAPFDLAKLLRGGQ